MNPDVETLGLKIPIALDAGGIPRRSYEGCAGQRYVCPSCGHAVSWRRRSVDGKRPHYAHLSDHDALGCSGESAVHDAAKHLVARRVSRFIAGEAPLPSCLIPCSRCRLPMGPIPLRELAEASSVHVEQVLSGGAASRRKPDVTVRCADGSLLLAIEILHTHEVDSEKSESLAEDSIQWVELQASPIVDDAEEWIASGFSLALGHYDPMCTECLHRWQIALEIDQGNLEDEQKSLGEKLRMLDGKRSLVRDEQGRLERLRYEVAAIEQKMKVLASAEKRSREIEFRAKQAEERVRQLSDEETLLRRAKLVDFEKLCANYREVFDKTQELNRTALRHPRKETE